MGTREDRLEEIETGFWERGPLITRNIKLRLTAVLYGAEGVIKDA